MSCFFCESFNHLSQNCNIHVTDKDRREIAETKKFCKRCFTDLSSNIHTWMFCLKNRKCYICFSEEHHTFFCHDKNLLASNIFLPKINENLFSRFMQIIHLEELILLLFSSPKAAPLVKTKQLIVAKIKTIHENHKNRNILITGSMCINGLLYSSTCLPSMKFIIFKGKSINIQEIKIDSQQFMQFLTSPKLKILRCSNVTLSENISFSQILQNAPNLDVIEFDSTNVDVDNSWPEEIIKWKNGASLTSLIITIPSIDINVNSLVTVMKEKSKKGVIITLNLYPVESNNVIENMEKKLLPYFKHVCSFFDVGKRLQIIVRNILNPSYDWMQSYVLKTVL